MEGFVRDGITYTMKKIAFIDANNTAATAERMLGFVVDWYKLCVFLKERWGCEKVFIYSGVDVTPENVFTSLVALGYVEVQAKETLIYKNPEKKITITCPNAACQKSFVKILDMGYRKKSNCDVELTMGVLDYAAKDTELFVFTGDGDFEVLFERAVAMGSVIKIVSHHTVLKDPKTGLTHSRFSAKLKRLFKRYPNVIMPMEIERIKHLIDIKKTPGLAA